MASEVSRVRTKHPKENRFLGPPKLFTQQAWMKWRQSYQGDYCDRAGLAELRLTVIRLCMAEAQPTNPDDKKHLLLKTGEIKWCWKCGARVERDSAPRLMLKPRAVALFVPRSVRERFPCSAKGNSSVFKGRPTPISDE